MARPAALGSRGRGLTTALGPLQIHYLGTRVCIELYDTILLVQCLHSTASPHLPGSFPSRNPH